MSAVETLAESNAKIAILQHVMDVAKEQMDELRKDHLELLRAAHIETGSKSWVARADGEDLATISIQFAAEKFEVADPQPLIEWLQEHAPELVKVEVMEEVIIPARSVTSVDEAALKKVLSGKGGKIFLNGELAVPEGLVKHTPAGRSAKGFAISKKDKKNLTRALSSALNPFTIEAPKEIEAGIIEVEAEEVMPWEQ